MCYCLKLNLGSFCHLMMNDSRTPLSGLWVPLSRAYRALWMANELTVAHLLRLGGIFEAFVTTKKKGMGLGLAICRRNHGGKLNAFSDGNSGARFQFILRSENVGRAE
jgi:hypothetical protein